MLAILVQSRPEKALTNAMEGGPSGEVGTYRVGMNSNKDDVSHRERHNAQVQILGVMLKNLLHVKYTIFHTEVPKASRLAVN